MHPGSIMRAGMDGSDLVTVVVGIGKPRYITIDFATLRLFWVDTIADRIESSNLQGGSRRTVVQLSSGYLMGIAVVHDRIYWGDYERRTLQSSTATGENIVTLHSETEYIYHLTVVPDSDLPPNRTNHCVGHNCEKVCVLTATSFRCLP